MALEDISRLVDVVLFEAPYAPDEYCDGHIAEFKGGDRTRCLKCGDNWLAYNTPKAHFPLPRHDYSMVEKDSLYVLSWLRSKYHVVIEWNEGGVVVKARENKFIPFWHEFSSGQCDALPLAACIVALQANGFGVNEIQGWLNR